jgi:protoporphyrinogen/coproporphyrinogen III oxidase
VGYTEKAVVIGAGISGLACAFRLKQLGVPCRVLEASDRPGGVIVTVRRNGFLFETGPQFPRFPAPVWRLVHDLNLEGEFITGNKKAKRYILHGGQMHLAPFSPGGLIATRLLSLTSKFRLLIEAFRSSSPPLREESLAEFVQRKFGTEVLDNLVDPFISTIFLGDPRKMGMESAFPALVQWERQQGSLVRGAIRAQRSKRAKPLNGAPDARQAKRDSLHVTDALPSLGSFESGMGRLPERLAEALRGSIHYNAEPVRIAPIGGESGTPITAWQIVLPTGDRVTTEHLVLAVPAYIAAQLLASSLPQLADLLGAIEYAPMYAVSSAYDRSQVGHPLDGFGFMVPRREGLRIFCTFWNSSLFPRRGPEGKVVITSFAGPEAGGDFEPAGNSARAKSVEAENASTLGISGPPIDRVVWQAQRAMPQYNVGHASRVTQIRELLHTQPRLHITGNFLKGRSIGDCVEIANQAADDLSSRIPP